MPSDNSEEIDFLQKLCNNILNTAKHIRFAGVINDEGKLLVGKYRPDIKTPFIKANTDLEHPKATSFYSAYEILALQRKFQSDLGNMKFQLTEFDRVTLVSIPLTAEYNRFLCISIDDGDAYQLIPKIFDMMT
jgi:hypothetical protein